MKRIIRKSALVILAVVLVFILCIPAFAESDSAEPVTVGDTATAEDEKTTSSDTSTEPVLTTGEEGDTATTGAEDDTTTVGATEETAETEEEEAEPLISFVLLQKMGKIFDGEHNTEMWLFIGALFVLCAMIVTVIIINKNRPAESFDEKKARPVNLLVTGALCLSLSFVLSYVKIFSMPFGGSITLCSMLPVMVYAAWAGPAYGFLTALAYAGLQIAQGAWIVHPVQFIFDYILGFTVLGLTSLFRSEKRLPLGILIAGFARMLCSSVAGLYYGVPEGIEMNIFVYALVYNFMCIGLDTIICYVVYLIPPVNKAFTKARKASLGI